MSDWEVVPESDWAVVKPDEAPEPGGPESFLHPKKFKPSPQHRKLKNTGSMEQVRQDLAPIDPNRDTTVSGPALSAIDRSSLGTLGSALRFDRDVLSQNPIARAVDAIPVLGPLIGKRGGETADTALQSMEGYRAAHPTLSRYTDIPGYFAGPAKAVATGLGTAGTRIAQLSPGNPLSFLLPAAGTPAIAQTMQAASEGASPKEALREGAEAGATGAAIATPLALAAHGAGAAGRAIQGSKGAQARRFLTERGVEVSPTSPGRGRVIDEMVTKGSTDADIGRQAEVSAQRGLDMLNEEQKAVKGIAGRRIGRLEGSSEAARLEDVSEVVRNMRSAMEELDTTPQARAALGDLVKSIEAKQGQGFNADTDNYLLSASDLNKLRRQLDRYAKTGTSTDASLSPLKAAAAEVRAMVDEGPFAQANKDYSRVTKDYQESRGLLGINKRPKAPEETEAARNKVKNLITRRGQNTVTAGGQEERLTKFEEKHPDIGEEFSRPEILRKRSDISFHLFPQHGGLIDRVGPQAAAVLHALGGVATGVLPALTLTNLPAIQARLLFGPSLAMQAMEPLMLEQIPRLTAAEREQR